MHDMHPDSLFRLLAEDDDVADLTDRLKGQGKRARLGRLPGVKVTGKQAQLLLPGT